MEARNAEHTPSVLLRVTFRQLLAAGDRDVTYTILRWILPQAQQLEKRAFVGYFLSFPDVSGPLLCFHVIVRSCYVQIDPG